MIPARSQRRWGPWRLDKQAARLSYEFPEGGPPYPIDLRDCTSSAAVLDWICQIAGKQWATDHVLAGLVRALDDILEPQANLCPGGRDKQVQRAVLAKAIQRVKVAPVVPAKASLLEWRRQLAPCSLALVIKAIEQD